MVFMQSLTLESATEKTVMWPRLLPRLHVKAFTGGLIVLLFIVVGIIGPSIAPFDPNKQELTAMMKAPAGIGAPSPGLPTALEYPPRPPRPPAPPIVGAAGTSAACRVAATRASVVGT